MNSQLLDKVPVVNRFLGENYTTKVMIWRRRGDKYQPELHDAVRYRYDDRPNAHVLDSGEEIPAVPLANIYTMTDGTPYFEAIEVEDGQYAPRDVLINSDKSEDEINWETLDEEYDIDVEKITEESRNRIENLVENYKPVKTRRSTEKVNVPIKRKIGQAEIDDNVIKNKDTRLNFFLDHFKEAEEKYGVGGFLKEHMNIILVVVTALAIGILFYTSPISSDAFMQMMGDLSSSMDTLSSQLETLQQSGGLG